MTHQTRDTVITVTADITVFMVHIRLPMARETGEDSVTAGIRMTIDASIPGPIMLPGKNREEGIVAREEGRIPLQRFMTLDTGSTESEGYMSRVFRRKVDILMTIDTVGRPSCKIPLFQVRVTAPAIDEIVPPHHWESGISVNFFGVEYFPPRWRMTPGALRTQFCFVNIRVAAEALTANGREIIQSVTAGT